MFWCQLTVAVLLFCSFLRGVHLNYRGEKGREPLGATGLLIDVGVVFFMGLLYWGAGAFSTLLP